MFKRLLRNFLIASGFMVAVALFISFLAAFVFYVIIPISNWLELKLHFLPDGTAEACSVLLGVALLSAVVITLIEKAEGEF